MRQRRCSSGCNSKGQVFTLDAVLGLFVLLIALSFISIRIGHAGVSLSSSNLRDVGNDVAAVLDIRGDLATLNNITIENGINATLHGPLAMRMTVTCDDGTSFSIGAAPSAKATMASGSRFFIATNDANCIEEHRVWHE